jgi:hypothetical protein
MGEAKRGEARKYGANVDEMKRKGEREMTRGNVRSKCRSD